MTSTSKKISLELSNRTDWIIAELETEQERDPSSPLFGNYPSTRYHQVFPIRRVEDNVYFVAWVNQLLKRCLPQFSTELKSRVQVLIQNGETAIGNYRNRYGDITYNFYRPNAWFPNGKLLSRFGRFQPTDDADDTSMAFRGYSHSQADAAEVKKIFQYQSNGKRSRWLRRLPKSYRDLGCYSTWIGSDKIYVDTDLVVLANILIFNAAYDLGVSEEDKASLLLLKKAVLSGDYLRKKWSISAWYPFESVILYSLAELVALDYYPGLDGVKTTLSQALNSIQLKDDQSMERLLVDSALIRLGYSPRFDTVEQDMSLLIESSAQFSYGIIPLLHPWNGQFMQYLSSFPLFRVSFDCRGQRLAILLELLLMRNSTLRVELHEKGESSWKEKEEQNPVSRIL